MPVNPEYKDRTVYVLGAGASREETKGLKSPLPLALEFFEPRCVNQFPMSRSNNKSGIDRFRNSLLEKSLNQYYDIEFKYRANKLIKSGRVNIEDVASFFLSSAEGQPDNPWFFFEPPVIYRELLEFIRDTVMTLSWGMSIVPNLDTFYHRLCKKLRPQDSIITFNWDCLVDRALEDTSPQHLNELFEILRPPEQGAFPKLAPDGRGTALKHRFQGQYLKVHGSMNWLRCTNRDCYRASYPIVGTFFDSEDDHIGRCDHCGALLEWCMMPPTQWKTYSDNRLFRIQFNLAHQLLDAASDIVIIGFSFSPYDVRSQHLFRSIRESEEAFEYPRVISIVNPAVNDPWFREQMTALLEGPKYRSGKEEFKNLINWYRSVDEYDASLVPAGSLKKDMGRFWRE